MRRSFPPTAVGPAPTNLTAAPTNMASAVAMPRMTTKPEKQWGDTVDCFVAVLHANESIKEFKKKLGTGDCTVIERFLHKNRVYFTGEVNPQAMHSLSINRRLAFKKEIRRSRVLILSIKDKRTLTLDEAREIVQMSDLRYSMDRIDLIAVNPKTKKRNDKGYNGMVHAYVQFLTEEDADRHVNSVDAMYYKGYYVHSPQCDEHSVFFPNDISSDSYVWRNQEARSISSSESEGESADCEYDPSYFLKELLSTPPPSPIMSFAAPKQLAAPLF